MGRLLGNRIRRIKRSTKVKTSTYLTVSNLRGSIISINNLYENIYINIYMYGAIVQRHFKILSRIAETKCFSETNKVN